VLLRHVHHVVLHHILVHRIHHRLKTIKIALEISQSTSATIFSSPDSRNFADMSASSVAVCNLESDEDWQSAAEAAMGSVLSADYFVMGSGSVVVVEVAIAIRRFPKNTTMTVLCVKVALSLSKYWICRGTQLFSMEMERDWNKEIKSKQTQKNV
jgi:hypothetical protein